MRTAVSRSHTLEMMLLIPVGNMHDLHEQWATSSMIGMDKEW